MQIFFSYSAKDKGYALALSSQLEKHGLHAWTFEGEILPGDNVWLRAGEAMKASRAMVVLLSPDSVRSEFVRREVEYALGNPAYEGRVFPVLVRPTKQIPWIIRRLKILDGKQNAAKLAASIAESLKQAA